MERMAIVGLGFGDSSTGMVWGELWSVLSGLCCGK
jgi:hypothetical protein